MYVDGKRWLTLADHLLQLPQTEIAAPSRTLVSDRSDGCYRAEARVAKSDVALRVSTCHTLRDPAPHHPLHSASEGQPDRNMLINANQQEETTKRIVQIAAHSNSYR